jgi:hypothetical protein
VSVSPPYQLLNAWTSFYETWYCRVYRVWLQTGYDLVDWIIDHLYAPLETTSNCSAVADLYTSQITAPPAKPFCSPLSLQQPFPRNGFWQWRFLSFPLSRRYCLTNIPKINSCQLTAQL